MLRRQPKFSRKEVLEAKPIQNPGTTWEKDLNEEVVVSIPRRNTGWINLLAKVFSIPPQRKIVLDRLGTEVWELCTGKNTVEDLVKVFHKKHKLTRKQAETAMMNYLNQMARRGLIAFLIENNNEDKKKDGSSSPRITTDYH